MKVFRWILLGAVITALFTHEIKAYSLSGEAYFLLGKKYYRVGRCERALEYFSKSEGEGYRLPALYYYRARCLFSQGKYTEAEKFFLRSAEEGFRVQSSYYFAGLAAYRSGRKGVAEKYLKETRRLGEGTIFARHAGLLLEKIKAKRRRLIWKTSASLSFEYDTNVILLPKGLEEYLVTNGEKIDKASTREVVNLQGGAYFLPADFISTQISLSYYENLHNLRGLRDYDMFSIVPSASVSFLIIKRANLMLNLRYNYERDLLGYSDYYQSHNISLFLSGRPFRGSLLTVGYAYRFDDFQELFLRGSPRDANVNEIRAIFQAKVHPFYIYFRGFYERNNAYSDYYRYGGAGGILYSKLTLPYRFTLGANATFIFRDYYRHPEGRNDTVQAYSVRLSRVFFKYLSASAYYSFIKNNSAQNYDYSRHLMGVEIGASI